MRTIDTNTTVISHAGLAVALCMSLACIPSFPSSESSQALDRSQPCNQEIGWPGFGLDDDGSLGLNACGYPRGSEPSDDNPAGDYGFDEGDVFENLLLFDCEGNQVQIAQYLPQFGLANGDIKGLVFSVGALWCMPCREEAVEWAHDFVDQYPGIQFVQALDEGPIGLDSVTPASCAGWSTTNGEDKFPILYDPEPQALQSTIEGQSGAGIPYTLIMDTNAVVRLKKVGGKLEPDTLTFQIEQLLELDDEESDED